VPVEQEWRQDSRPYPQDQCQDDWGLGNQQREDDSEDQDLGDDEIDRQCARPVAFFALKDPAAGATAFVHCVAMLKEFADTAAWAAQPQAAPE